MADVVNNGTGKPAQIKGITVAGKQVVQKILTAKPMPGLSGLRRQKLPR